MPVGRHCYSLCGLQTSGPPATTSVLVTCQTGVTTKAMAQVRLPHLQGYQRHPQGHTGNILVILDLGLWPQGPTGFALYYMVPEKVGAWWPQCSFPGVIGALLPRPFPPVSPMPCAQVQSAWQAAVPLADLPEECSQFTGTWGVQRVIITDLSSDSTRVRSFHNLTWPVSSKYVMLQTKCLQKEPQDFV